MGEKRFGPLFDVETDRGRTEIPHDALFADSLAGAGDVPP